jgi:hypothetical protein
VSSSVCSLLFKMSAVVILSASPLRQWFEEGTASSNWPGEFASSLSGLDLCLTPQLFLSCVLY